MTDLDVAIELTKGTTCKAKQLRVLYNDGERAIVTWPGAKVGRLFRDWVPAETRLHDLARSCMWDGKPVWFHGRDEQGPLTRKRLVALVEKLGLDPQFIRS